MPDVSSSATSPSSPKKTAPASTRPAQRSTSSPTEKRVSGLPPTRNQLTKQKNATFSLAARLIQGYDQTEVDEFFSRAQLAYESAVTRPETGARPATANVVPDKKDPATMTAEDVRKAAFTLRRGGYVVTEVDAALDRLEDALAASQRTQLMAAQGEEAVLDELTRMAETLQGRIARPDGERFSRGIRGWERTYDIKEVDDLCHRLDGYFNYGEEMSVDEVRRAAFRSRRGNLGYREPVVDAFLDRVVTVMSAVD